MTQKAIVLTAIGAPLELTTRPIPSPGPGDLLVKVLITSLNPHESHSKYIGLFVENTYPTPTGLEFVGTITQIGEGVQGFKIGDTIIGYGEPTKPDYVGTQEYALVPSRFSSLLPSNVTLDEALTFPLNAQTSYVALFHPDGFGLPQPYTPEAQEIDYPSKSIVIVGGGAATGKFGIEFARLVGFGNVIAIASKTNETLLKSLGATHVIDRHLSPEDQNIEVRKITGDDLLYVYDVVNVNSLLTNGLSFLSNTKKGMIISITGQGVIDIEATGIDIGPKLAGYVKKDFYMTVETQLEATLPFWKNSYKWIEDGTLKPTNYKVYKGWDVEKVNELLDEYAKGLGNVVKPHFHWNE